jgi:hypothetical protein
MFVGATGQTGIDPSVSSMIVGNPGMAGVQGGGKLYFSYKNIYPGNRYNIYNLRAVFDGFFEGIHGGASFFVTNDKMGEIVDDLNTGFSYSYHFRAGDDFYVGAGLSASLFYRGYDFSGAVLPDQIDAVMGVVYPSGEIFVNRNIMRPDISSGVVLMFGNYYAGFSVAHLTQPSISGTDYGETLLRRKLIANFGGEIGLNDDVGLILRPVSAVGLGKELFSATLGASLEIPQLSVNSLLMYHNNDYLDLHLGVTATAGTVTLYYNYLFNILSYNNIFSVALHHQVGLSIGLYSVDKRKSFKTMNFSKI